MSRGAYGAPVPAGGTIAAVDDGSPAARAGLRPGDRVLSVDGEPIRDVIDWRWATASGAFDVIMADAAGSEYVARVESEWGESPGVGFSGVVFDAVRECDNACEFCFVSQLPPGLRPSLYVRDDDYRLSFLVGNFVTLTNLSDDDVERILEQRLSPLHWSLQAVDGDVRRSLVCPTGEDRALEHASRLLAGGIRMHVQIVLVPGRNDGEVLQGSLEWLSGHEGVLSVGVVPVGFTRHQTRYTASYGDPAAAASVLEALEPWRERMRAERNVSWVHGADELYLAAGRAVPPAEDYDGYPQYENGIGMVRAFVDAWEASVERDPAPLAGVADRQTALATGELFAPVLARLLEAIPRQAARPRVLAVPNRFLGGNVSVAGLVTARDLAGAIGQDGRKGVYLVPDVMFNSDGMTIDEVSRQDLPGLCQADVRVVSSDSADPIVSIRDALTDVDR